MAWWHTATCVFAEIVGHSSSDENVCMVTEYTSVVTYAIAMYTEVRM